MSFKSTVAKLLPRIVVRTVSRVIAGRNLRRIPTVTGAVTNLRRATTIDLDDMLRSKPTAEIWRAARTRLDQLAVSTSAGGVNPGDRQALFFLISALAPETTLEIGTHIGASTIHIAEALRSSKFTTGEPARLVTVDILDVNSELDHPWRQQGSRYSPAEMIDRLTLTGIVRFVAQDSMSFLSSCRERFDFIFLDGSHEASMVYQEIPLALARLKPEGVILLHDYFPSLRPLWSNGYVIPGPALAVQRLTDEGLPLQVVPLGDLPWPTKLGSHRTSLAILLRKG